MRRRSHESDGFFQTYCILSDFGVCAVVAIGINLVVDAVGPVVVGHLTVFGVYVTIDKVLSPYVPHFVPFVG